MQYFYCSLPENKRKKKYKKKTQFTFKVIVKKEKLQLENKQN